MATRTSTSTLRRNVSFNIDEYYYIPGRDKSLVFDGRCKNYKFAVCYTKVVKDTGYVSANMFGSPCMEYYDNGLVGYQNINFFNSREEAERDYEIRKKLSPKVGVVAYSDVFLVEND